MKIRSFPLIGALLWAVNSLAAQTPISPATVISLFNGRDLSSFVTWLVDFKHEDPDRVFTVVDQIDGAPAIRASGQHLGGLVTKERYANYRLVVEYRWGLTTWAPRKDKARDSGILLHCQGAFGNNQADFNSPWMRSVEFQIIEGGTGDVILVGGFDEKGGPRIPTALTTRTDGTLPRVWKPDGQPSRATARTNWYGRDPKWTGALGFRGPRDVERPVGAWNRAEITCDGDNLVYVLNGTKVNEGTQCSLSEGRLLFQSEGAEIFFRRIELHPLSR